MKRNTVFMAVIIIAVIGGALFLSFDKLERSVYKIESILDIGKPALKLTVSTGINESDGSPVITNITFEQTRVIYKGTDTRVEYPEISVVARKDSIRAPPVTYWAAQPWIEGNETYTLTLSFRESYTPETGDFLILTIRFTGLRGFILGRNTAFYEWQ